MRIGKPKTPAAVPAAPSELQDMPAMPDDPEQADQARAQAAQLRADVEQAHSQVTADLQNARTRAAQIIADAEQHARDLTIEAKAAGKRAADLEERARLVDYAHSVRQQAEGADEQAERLADEAATLTEKADALTRRLTELGTQREDATTSLGRARESGDVAAVTTLRAQLAALDEVTAVLTGQRDTAQRRVSNIGEEGWGGELDQALAAAHGHREKLSGLLDQLDPSRVEKRRTEVMARCVELAQGDVATATYLAWVALEPEAAAAVYTDQDPGKPPARTQMQLPGSALPLGIRHHPST